MTTSAWATQYPGGRRSREEVWGESWGMRWMGGWTRGGPSYKPGSSGPHCCQTQMERLWALSTQRSQCPRCLQPPWAAGQMFRRIKAARPKPRAPLPGSGGWKTAKCQVPNCTPPRLRRASLTPPPGPGASLALPSPHPQNVFLYLLLKFPGALGVTPSTYPPKSPSPPHLEPINMHYGLNTALEPRRR